MRGVASNTVRSTVTKDGMVLLDTSTGKIFNSNAVGARIWLKLQDGLDLDTITEQISAEFSVASSRVLPDVSAFFEALKANGLLAEQYQK
jgi:hypothetical protein